MEKGNLKEILCARFCNYYKPDKDEELACQGFLVTAELIKRKKISLPETLKNPSPDIQEALIRHVCDLCPFHEHDCDFYEHGEGFPPCGGFLFLGTLLEKRLLTIDNIKDIR